MNPLRKPAERLVVWSGIDSQRLEIAHFALDPDGVEAKGVRPVVVTFAYILRRRSTLASSMRRRCATEAVEVDVVAIELLVPRPDAVAEVVPVAIRVNVATKPTRHLFAAHAMMQ